MGVAASVYSRNTTHSGVSNLIGDRCYPQRMPDKVELPCVVFYVISAPPNEYSDHDASPPDRWVSRVQMDAYADTRSDAEDVKSALFSAWEGYRSGTAVGWARVANMLDDYEPGLNRYRKIVEVVIDHEV